MSAGHVKVTGLQQLVCLKKMLLPVCEEAMSGVAMDRFGSIQVMCLAVSFLICVLMFTFAASLVR